VYNVVTDGNQGTSRRPTEDEKKIVKSGLAGRPKGATNKKGPLVIQKEILKKPSLATKVLKKPALGYKLCKYVSKLQHAKKSRTHTGGLYATVDMETLRNKGNLVLHVTEMLNNENKAVKEFAINDMVVSSMPVKEFAHDCACQFKREWESRRLVKFCRLDGFHWKTHKCNVEKVTNPRFNSQAAEQLWSRLDNLHFMTEYSRARYRFFLRHYFVWRNNFLRLTSRTDSNPNVSSRQVRRHQ